jgi:hypothetical protein
VGTPARRDVRIDDFDLALLHFIDVKKTDYGMNRSQFLQMMVRRGIKLDLDIDWPEIEDIYKRDRLTVVKS